jgi:hypothetical protein
VGIVSSARNPSQKSTSNIMPFSGPVLGSRETPFRPISPEWVWPRLADYVAVKMSRQDRDRAVPETTTPRLDGGVRTSFLGPKLAVSVSGRLLPMGRLAVQLS